MGVVVSQGVWRWAVREGGAQQMLVGVNTPEDHERQRQTQNTAKASQVCQLVKLDAMKWFCFYCDVRIQILDVY